MKKQGIKYEFIDVKEEPLTRGELKELEFKVGLDVLVNKRGMTWRNLGLAEKNPDDEQLFGILLENQTMIKRPVLIDDESVMVGYDEEAFDAFVAEEEHEK